MNINGVKIFIENTYSHIAYEFFIAYGLIGFVNRSRTSRSHSVTVTSIAATVVVATKIAYFQIAFICTAWTLKIK